MRSKTGFVGILLATLGLLLQPFPALSCSAFLVASDDLVLFGNNEDYWNPATRMWFVPGDDGSLGRDYFGYDDMLPLSPYTEWYENAIKFPWSPSARHHREHHGDKKYAEFAVDFVRGARE